MLCSAIPPWSHAPVLNDLRHEVKHVCTFLTLASCLLVCQHLIDCPARQRCAFVCVRNASKPLLFYPFFNPAPSRSVFLVLPAKGFPTVWC